MSSTVRPLLSRDRILRAALDLADRDGFESCTMRNLGARLGVEAMSLYRHVASKDDLLDGLVDLVFAEIAVEAPGTTDWRWRPGARARPRPVASARASRG